MISDLFMIVYTCVHCCQMGAVVGQCGYHKKCAVNEIGLVKKCAMGGPEVGMGWAGRQQMGL